MQKSAEVLRFLCVFFFFFLIDGNLLIGGFPGGSDGKEFVCNAGGPGSIPGLGRSPGEGNGNPFQYSCLENSMDRGAWWATVHGVYWVLLQKLLYILTPPLPLQSSLEFSENPLNKTYFSTCSMCIFFPPLPTSVVFLLLLDNLPNKLPGQSPCLGLCSQENQAESRYEKCTRLIHIQQT